MTTPEEAAAVESIRAAMTALRHAHELSERAGWKIRVAMPLKEAYREAEYALDVALHPGHDLD